MTKVEIVLEGRFTYGEDANIICDWKPKEDFDFTYFYDHDKHHAAMVYKGLIFKLHREAYNNHYIQSQLWRKECFKDYSPRQIISPEYAYRLSNVNPSECTASQSIEISSVSKEDEGIYWCEVIVPGGKTYTSHPTFLKVHGKYYFHLFSYFIFYIFIIKFLTFIFS